VQGLRLPSALKAHVVAGYLYVTALGTSIARCNLPLGLYPGGISGTSDINRWNGQSSKSNSLVAVRINDMT
jgi:hypothetical protein